MFMNYIFKTNQKSKTVVMNVYNILMRDSYIQFDKRIIPECSDLYVKSKCTNCEKMC